MFIRRWAADYQPRFVCSIDGETGAEGGSGSGAGGDGGDNNGSSQPMTLTFTDPDAIAFMTEQQFETGDAAVTRMRELEAAAEGAEGRIEVPDATADEDAVSAYIEQLPKVDVENIAFMPPANLPEGVTYNQDFADAMKPVMSEMGLHPRQMQAVHDAGASYLIAQQQAAKAERAAEAEKAETALRQQPAFQGEKFDQQVTAIEEALTDLDTEFAEVLGGENKFFEMVNGHGLQRNPGFMMMMTKFIAATAEDTLQGGGGSQPGNSGGQPKTPAQIVYGRTMGTQK